MSDRLTQLVGSSPNFAFLAQPAMVLAGDAAAAEFYLHSDPDVSMFMARRFSETLARLVLLRAGLNVPKNQLDRIKGLVKAGLIDERVRELLDVVRVNGNTAVHERSGDAEKAQTSLEACFQLAAWWHERDNKVSVPHAFVTPVPPPAAESTAELREDLEAQLTDLHAKLEAALGAQDPALAGLVAASGTTAPAPDSGGGRRFRVSWKAAGAISATAVVLFVVAALLLRATATPSTEEAIVGTWSGVDTVDQSRMTLTIVSTGDATYRAVFEDALDSGFCGTTSGTMTGAGVLTGNRLTVTGTLACADGRQRDGIRVTLTHDPDMDVLADAGSGSGGWVRSR